MARIKLKAKVPFNVLEATGLPAGSAMQLVAITDTEDLLVFDTVDTPNIDDDQCIPLVFGAQAVDTDSTGVGIWLYSDDNAQVYVDRPFDPTWLANNPQ